jgi:hypothetical protein
MVTVPRRGVFMVSGTQVVQLADAANVDIGWPIRIVWHGVITLPGKAGEEDRTMKRFELFIAEGDPVSPEDLPKINDHANAD